MVNLLYCTRLGVLSVPMTWESISAFGDVMQPQSEMIGDTTTTFEKFQGIVEAMISETLKKEMVGHVAGDILMMRGLKKFRGVTKHKRTQRYEAHIWESKKQIYLGGFESELLAARSHDIMALKCKGPTCEALNFDGSDYAELIPLLPMVHKEDIIACLRNYSKGYGVHVDPNRSAHSAKPMNFKLSVQNKPLKIKKRIYSTGENQLPMTPQVGSQKMAPNSPTVHEPSLFDPVQPVDDLCPESVFDDQNDNPLTYSPFDELYIFDSFSSGMQGGGGSMLEHLSGGALLSNGRTASQQLLESRSAMDSLCGDDVLAPFEPSLY